MIDLYYWTTPNGHKITIFLEEAKLPYKINPIHIGEGEQFNPEFLKISPNNKIPAIVDHQPQSGNKPMVIFESGAILVYLADKIKQFIPQDPQGRYQTLEWLFWQMASLGPVSGQNKHFKEMAEKLPYAIERFVKETTRLYTVLNKQLEKNEYIAGSYSIADIACYPWVVPHEAFSQNLADFPHIHRWFTTIQSREAVKRAYAIAEEIKAKAEKKDQNGGAVCDISQRKS